MPKPTCSVPACETISHRAGRCVTHYRHALESGETGQRVPCKWEGCEAFASTRGYCHTHYARADRLKDFERPWAVQAQPKPVKEVEECRWPECDRTASGRGFCGRCHKRAWKLGDYDSPWIAWNAARPAKNPECKWPGCELPSQYAGFCSRDYSRSKIAGNTIDPWNDWNTSGKCEVCGKAWEGARNRNKRVCSKSCHTAAWRLENPEKARASKMDAVRRRRARLQDVQVDYFSIADVRMTHGDDCYICGKSINYSLKFPHPKSPSLDHVQPLSAGGSHTLENVAMTHLECNLKKHAAPAVQLPQPTLLSL